MVVLESDQAFMQWAVVESMPFYKDGSIWSNLLFSNTSASGLLDPELGVFSAFTIPLQWSWFMSLNLNFANIKSPWLKDRKDFRDPLGFLSDFWNDKSKAPKIIFPMHHTATFWRLFYSCFTVQQF